MAYNSNYGGGQNYGNQQTSYGQYSTTSYGAQGGADGGGFMGGSQGGSQGAGKANYGKDTLRPITIFQANNAHQPHPDAEFSLDDTEITQVTFVGQIRNISQQTTNMTYKLDDGTGIIEVKLWTDSDAPVQYDEYGGEIDEPKPVLKNGDWARVWGRLKEFHSRRHVGAHVIRPVKDKNEISYHLLEATFVHLYLTRGPPEQFTSLTAAGAGNAAGNNAQGGQQQQQQQQQQGDYENRALPQMSMVARRVYQALQNTPQMNEGLHIQNLAAVTGMQLSDVQKGGEELTTLNLIFPTVDDHTWALLEQ